MQPKKKKFIQRLRDKYRLVILNDESFEEKFSFRLSRLNLFTVIGSATVVLIILTSLLIAFTPLKEFIPGYAGLQDTRTKLLKLTLKTDSMEIALTEKSAYLNSILLADFRLTPIGRKHGLVDDERWERMRQKSADLMRLQQFAESTSHDGIKIAAWLKRPNNFAVNLPASLRASHANELWEALEINLKYEGYIIRQNIAIDRLQRQEEKRIPRGLDYLTIRGLRFEAQQKLAQIQPETLGQASRISGVTPADLALLSVWMDRE